MTKIKLFQLRLFRTIRRQICSIDMIDIETFTNIFRLLNQVDRSIIEKYIQGYSIKSIADESEYSKAFGKLPILGYPLLDGRQSAPV